jgi:uncharacterized protein YqhQ
MFSNKTAFHTIAYIISPRDKGALMTKEKLPSYGGQALIEGVMMRGGNSVVVAMRHPDDHIEIHKETLSGIYTSKIKRIPFLRGLIILWDSLVLGTKMLTLSANLQSGEDEKIEGKSFYLMLAISLLIAVGVFFLLPVFLSNWLEKLLGLSSWWGGLIEGIIRLLMFITYIWAIGKLKDIERVFAYHGAEHKTINAYEAGEILNNENIKKHSVEHTRCGTSFLISVVLFSILLFSLLGPLPLAWRLLSRILALPILGGVAYEYIRWSANHSKSFFIKFLIKPNLWVQKLTTRQPDEKMIEVSLAALNELRNLEDTFSPN